MTGQTPYTWLAPVYDALSFERPVYRAGRVAGVEELHLERGDRVVDIGCGTGLSLVLLRQAVGKQGFVVGVDASRQMLRQAGARARRHGWTNIALARADATAFDVSAVRALLPGQRADAVLFTYALSLMPAWPDAWARALALARPGARIAVVDMQLPVGWARAWSPLARLACAAGGADIHAHPWTAVERDLTEVSARSARGGHIQVRAGTASRMPLPEVV